MTNPRLKIGILNLMHDKAATQQRFSSIFKALDPTVELTFSIPLTTTAIGRSQNWFNKSLNSWTLTK